MWQDIDEVSDLDSSLLFVFFVFVASFVVVCSSFARLRLAHVWVVLLGHKLVADCVFEGIGVESSMAPPRRMIAIQDLLS